MSGIHEEAITLTWGCFEMKVETPSKSSVTCRNYLEAEELREQRYQCSLYPATRLA